VLTSRARTQGHAAGAVFKTPAEGQSSGVGVTVGAGPLA